MSGTKTIVNNSSQTLLVTLVARASDNPQNPTVREVCANIGPGERKTLTYGDDSNPYLNGLTLLVTDGSSYIEQSWLVIQRGGPGTIDSMLNANSVVEIDFNTASKSFSVTVHN